MKSYEEMAARVLERRDRYVAEKKAARKNLSMGLACAACAALAVFAGVGTFSTDEPPQVNVPGVQDLHDIRKESLRPHVQASEQAGVWKTAAEILEEDRMTMGVFVPGFVAYNGGFYGGAGFDQEKESAARFAPAGDEVWFSEAYRFPAYQVQDAPDCIAIVINGGVQVYQNVFDVTFELDGKIYGIAYAPVMDVEVEAGEAVQEGPGFTVYQAKWLQGKERDACLVNILPLLKERWPVLFDDGENHSEAWMVAMPMAGTGTDMPVVENPGSTGALVRYEEVWGGSYTDRAGNMVVWLTENTPENRQKVFERNPALWADSTIFKDADYSLAYLTQLLADISKLMGNGQLPHVPTAALREDINRVEVSLTCEDESCMERVLVCDTLGGAVEFRFSEGGAIHDVMIMKESQK